MKKLQFIIEALLLRFLFLGFRWLPVDMASSLGALMAKSVGPLFSAHKTCKKNLAAAFPELSSREIDALSSRIWANLGRNGAEYALLAGKKLEPRIEVFGAEHLPKKGEATLVFTGHIGNWELLCHSLHAQGLDPVVVYRHVNNPYVDRIIADARASHVGELIAKGQRGGLKILSAIKRGEVVAMLIDQKQNNGIAVPFFGRDAMTSPAIAEIALKYNVNLLPLRIIRKKGAHFECHFYPMFKGEKTGEHKKDVLALMTKLNGILEGWIRDLPDQWFWVHRRWPKEPRA